MIIYARPSKFKAFTRIRSSKEELVCPENSRTPCMPPRPPTKFGLDKSNELLSEDTSKYSQTAFLEQTVAKSLKELTFAYSPQKAPKFPPLPKRPKQKAEMDETS